jgi:hypothetical protein
MAMHERRLVLLIATILAASLLVYLSVDRDRELHDSSKGGLNDTRRDQLSNVISETVNNSGKAEAAEAPPESTPSIPVKSSLPNAADFGEQRDKSAVDYVSLLEGDDTPPWPPGTEDRIYQAIAEQADDFPITGIVSVECAGNLCTILLSVPDLYPADSADYDSIVNSLLQSDLEIGGVSISFEDYAPGVRLIRLGIDNIEWTDERLQQVREAAATKAKLPDRN